MRPREAERPDKSTSSRLSWDETARAMAASDEDWSEWDVTLADGLERVPWERVTEEGGE
jgi:hypothetical protein